MLKYEVAPRGDRTVYVRHGIWYDKNTKHIHVTVPDGPKGAHWSYAASNKRYGIYREILQEMGRWPEGVD